MATSVSTSAAKAVLYRSGLIALSRGRTQPRAGVRVLRYHSVSPLGAAYRADAISVSPADFARQMRFLARHYTVIGLDRVADHIIDGTPLPPRAACITFDDGYKDNVVHAFPILADLRLPATFFITAGPVVLGTSFWVAWVQHLVMTTAYLDRLAAAFDLTVQGGTEAQRRQKLADALTALAARRSTEWRDAMIADAVTAAPDAPPLDRAPYMMTVEDLRTLHAGGMTIGAHTVTHPILSSQDDATALHELTEARRLLEDAIGAGVHHLAYPNAPGVLVNFDDRTRRLARQAGYRSGNTSRRGMVDATSDPLALTRQGVHNGLDEAAFAFRLEEHHFTSLLRR
ncbi:MAG: polysaccharide deacetylase family protein [Rhodospirillaceae bacterium]